MLQPRIYRNTASVDSSLTSLATVLNALSLCPKHTRQSVRPSTPLAKVFTRQASHAAQGRANGPKDSAGRRLGAKKSAQQYVVPGNIIFKQRGTKWFAGENAGIGKDHTIYATVSGYVRYYRNPLVHPKRRYIGVALEREGPRSKLPTPPNAPTRRRLGMYAVPIPLQEATGQSSADFMEAHLSQNSKATTAVEVTAAPTAIAIATVPRPTRREGTYRMANFEIGRAAERKGIKVREFDRKDRWLAWRKRAKRVKESMLARAAKANRKTKGKKSNKGANVGVR